MFHNFWNLNLIIVIVIAMWNTRLHRCNNGILVFKHILDFKKCSIQGNFTIEIQRSQNNFALELIKKLDAVNQILSGMPRKFWKCDPSRHIEGETYLALKGFLQVQFFLCQQEYRRKAKIKKQGKLSSIGTESKICKFGASLFRGNTAGKGIFLKFSLDKINYIALVAWRHNDSLIFL